LLKIYIDQRIVLTSQHDIQIEAKNDSTIASRKKNEE